MIPKSGNFAFRFSVPSLLAEIFAAVMRAAHPGGLAGMHIGGAIDRTN
jgi:hypothetical protein